MTGKSMPHATHGHRGHVPTSAAKITKESAVNHKEIDTNGVNRMLLRRPWRNDQKNRFLDKVWTPQFSTTPPKPFLLSFSTHLGDQTLSLARSIWKRKSQFSNRPLYLLLSGFARGQALGCHAVARADRMQKTHWKVCRNTSEITENDWSVVLNRRLTVSTFSPNHWSWRCHLLAPRWAEIDCLASGAERAREIKEKKQLAIADAGAAAAAAQSEGETSSRRACGSRKADRGTQETWGRNGASTCLLECENASSKVALSHTLFWERERKRRLGEAFISGLSVVQWKALWKSLGIELKEKILSQSVLLTRKEAGRTWEVLVGWQWWPLKTICSWWPVWGSGSGGCSRSWHTFLVCRRLVCHSPFKKWISFLYLRLGRLPPWPSWEDVKASRVLPCKLPWHIYCLGCHRVVHRNS